MENQYILPFFSFVSHRKLSEHSEDGTSAGAKKEIPAVYRRDFLQ